MIHSVILFTSRYIDSCMEYIPIATSQVHSFHPAGLAGKAHQEGTNDGGRNRKFKVWICKPSKDRNYDLQKINKIDVLKCQIKGL